MTTKKKRKAKETALVSGYVRQHKRINQYIPPDIINVCTQFYHIVHFWDNRVKIKSEFTIIDDTFFKKVANTPFRITNAYSYDVIKYPNIKIWRIKLFDDKNSAYFDDTFIGIISTSKVNNYTHWRTFYDEIDDGYALCTVNGNIFYKSQRKKYRPIMLKSGDIISIKCDLSKPNGTLSYFINNTYLGIAFDKIDINKSYRLCVDFRGDGGNKQRIQMLQ